MWENVKTSRNTVILSLSYEDFATIQVEKRMRNNGMIEYEISFHIEDVHDSIISCFKLEDVEKILKVSKSLIENLYDEIDGMDDIEIDEWIEDFEDQVNDFQ